MTLEELEKAVKAEKQRFNRVIFNLKLKYAKENAAYEIGDIVEDQTGVHLLVSIRTYDDFCLNQPALVFNSKQLRKSDLKDMKNPRCFQVYEKNIKRKVK